MFGQLLQPALDELCSRVKVNAVERRELFLSIRLDWIDAVHESEFFDLHPGKFHSKLLRVYLMGRLPCGWVGRYPQGKVVVH